MFYSVLFVLPFLSGIHALNDWSVPCINGECSYDLPSSDKPEAGSGTLKIWGSDTAITDITKAAHWQILGCDPNALSQDIRLVCMNDPDDPSSNCEHLYKDIGAVNKIVRLPENCGASAFARISRSWVPDDQSIPASVRRGLVRRDGVQPVVKALALDTDFDKVEWSRTGKVNFAINAANIPGSSTDFRIPPSRRWASRRGEREYERDRRNIFGDLGKAIDKGINKAKEGLGKAADKVGQVIDGGLKKVGEIGDKVEEKVKDAVDDVKAAGKVAGTVVKAVAENSLDSDNTFTIQPINENKHAELFNDRIDCAGVSASLQVDLDGTANAQASLRIVTAGTIVPFNVTSFKAIAGLNGEIDGKLSLNAEVTGHVDSGNVRLLEIGIPGFDFKGILTVGPSFTLDGQISGDVDIVMDASLGMNLKVNNAQLTFPRDEKSQPVSSAFTIGDTPITMNADAGVSATGVITAHLIPGINLGVSALANKVDVKIDLTVDAHASLRMNLDGSISATKTIGARQEESEGEKPEEEDAAVEGEDAAEEDASTDDGSVTEDDTATDGTQDTENDSETVEADAVGDSEGETAAGTGDEPSSDAETVEANVGDSKGETVAGTTDETSDIPEPAPQAASGVTTTFGGCINIDGGVTVNVGAQGDFFGLFPGGAQSTLFNKDFKIFTKCFGDQAQASKRAVRTASLERRALTCPLGGSGKKQSVTNNTVKSSDIKL
ncbi:hypothetical protein R3P38DRAFT_2615803 [Favolaschia claudopus]|uniref:DUF7223 domain-containing protein n=1 Tax=Favolaschia claudopus TaxID=2862362 RepID=A0AAW0CIP0_9AGAR